MTHPFRALVLGVGAAILSGTASAQKDSDVRLDTDLAVKPSWFPEVAASGDSVYVTWWDQRSDPNLFDPVNCGDIYFNRSLDGGATWLSADVMLNTEHAPETCTDPNPRISASGSSVYVVWPDCRDGVGDIYFNRSLDGGTSWLPDDVRLDTDVAGAAASELPQIASSGSAVYVTWHDRRNGSADIYFNCSLDGGSSWLPNDVRLDTDTAGAFASRFPQISASGASVYVTWEDERNGSEDVYFNRSLDGGATWLVADVRIDSGAGAGSAVLPRISSSGASVYVGWEDNRNGAADIYFNRSLDSGTSWLAGDVRVETSVAGASASAELEIASTGASVYATWRESRSGSPDIFFSRSLDGGATWLATDRRLDTDPAGFNDSFDPQVACSGASVYVVWRDQRDNSFGVFFNRSLDSGDTWMTVDTQLDRRQVFGLAFFPTIAVSDCSVYVCWSDTRNGDGDVFFNIPFGSQPYGVGKAGSGGFVPQLVGDDCLTLGSTYRQTLSDGLGDADGVLAVGFGPASQVSLPAVGGTLFVNPVILLPFKLEGGAGVPGAGSLEISIEIPPLIRFLGTNMNTQAGIVDGGATFGISLSNAVEAWVL